MKLILSFFLVLCFGFNANAKGVNFKEAVEILTPSAKKGDAVNQANLGFFYISGGNGLKRDVEKALYWYKKSAKQGNLKALTDLGWIYKTGFGVEKNLTQSYIWYSKALANGERSAQLQLDLLCEDSLSICK